MKIAVAGLWHLGTVTAACMASLQHHVIAYDENPETIAKLKQGHAVVFEPGLDDLIQAGLKSGCLNPSDNAASLAEAEIIWVTYDTPVDDHDKADVQSVISSIEALLPQLQTNAIVLISSQLPVGTTAALSQRTAEKFPDKNIHFAVSPENLRLGKAISVFMQPERVVIGIEHEADKAKLTALLSGITDNIVWMRIASAEMTKHALNAFLATSVVFINEIASLCEKVGADAREVERGLKSEGRIGAQAYLKPGGAIAGGTLARDVNFLVDLSRDNACDSPLFSALLTSNEKHKRWACHRLVQLMGELKGKTITALGLTYKAGTDTLRRSMAVELCAWLSEQGARVLAFDPAVKTLPEHLSATIELKPTLAAALEASDACVVATEWPDFSALESSDVIAQMRVPRVLDATGFLMKKLGADARIHYYTVGKSS